MTHELTDITKVNVLEDYNLLLTFEDGFVGKVDIEKIISFEGIFAPLKDRAYFASVMLNPELGTICWENGADLSPCFLREKAQ